MKNKKSSSYDYVNPLINTAKPKPRWVFFQSAGVPFGMVQLSPDTNTNGTWGVGYRYYSKRVKCFSHIHSWQLGAIAVLPFHGEYAIDIKKGYLLNHEGEEVRPGYHKLILEDCGITAELTASARVGFHRYRYPTGAKKAVLIDLGKTLGPSVMSLSKIQKSSSNALEGYVDNAPTVRRPRSCRIFFRIEFDSDFEKLEQGEKGETMVFFGGDNTFLQMKVSLSYVDEKGAALNMLTEMDHWDFERAVLGARKQWEEYLDRIKVEGGTKKQRIKFYTDLWRTACGGHVINDVDGRYCDRTGKEPVIREIPRDEEGKPQFKFISNADIFWGAHWSLGLLWDIAYPDVKSDYCRSMIEMYKHGGLIPRGPSGGNYTFVMIAAHSGAFIISAYMKGIRDFDVEKAYEGIRKNALPGGLMSKSGYEHNTGLDGGIEEFIDRGYIPERKRKSKGMHCDGAAQTLEYCYDHWCVAQLAKALGKKKDYKYFSEKSKNYKNLYDYETGFMRPRREDGKFISPFGPLELKGFCEGNGWGYTFYVPHDIKGLAGLMGGREKLCEKLHLAFEAAGSMKYYASKPKLERNKAYINYGNENTRFTAHVFNHVDRPYLTQKWSREVYEKLFSSVSLKSFCEDDDCGLAAGTGVLLALGLFDLKGGAYADPAYELGSPVFDCVTINLCKKYCAGDKFVMEMKNNGPGNPYIASARYNGKEIPGTISHEMIAAGGVLEIEMSNNPVE